jgi:Ca2+-binding RTX toxin-like protein
MGVNSRTRAGLAALLSAVVASLSLASQAGATTVMPVTSDGTPDSSSSGAPRELVGDPADARIVGGSTVNIAQYPWQAALVLDEALGTNDFEGQFCGGTFITSRIIQTAAHCVFDTDPDVPSQSGSDPGGDGTDFLDPNDVNIVGGRTFLNDGTTGTVGAGELNVQALYFAATFDQPTLQNDLAWIVTTAVHSQTNIDIAGAGETEFWDTNSPTQVSGWGTTSFGGSSSNHLKAATVPVISDTDMADPLVYGSDFFPASMLGAGVLAGGTDACQGDSGGPLVGPSTAFPGTPSAVRLVGVVSFGIGCGGQNKPGVYTRIAQFGIQNAVDTIETLEGTGDGGLVTGAGGLTPAPNGPGQSVIRPAPPPQPPQPPAQIPCKGKPAIIVGTDGPDQLSGTPGTDVIVGLGGNDKLSGLAGNDLLCGGAGKDTLKGGKGKDSLLGQKGKDALKGGPGRDVCKGGKGNDTAAACEVEKSI